MADRVTAKTLEDTLYSVNSYIRHLDRAGIVHDLPRTLELRRQSGGGRYFIVEVLPDQRYGERDWAAARSGKEMRAYLQGLHRGIGLIAMQQKIVQED